MINAQPARKAVQGAARAKPPAARARPVTIGPTTAPRLRALLLKASIVPRAVSESSATMVWMPGTPNHVPNAQTAKMASEIGSATAVTFSDSVDHEQESPMSTAGAARHVR